MKEVNRSIGIPEPSFPSDFVPSAAPPSLMADHSVSSGRGIIVFIPRLSTSSISPERITVQFIRGVKNWPGTTLPNSNYIFLGARVGAPPVD